MPILGGSRVRARAHAHVCIFKLSDFGDAFQIPHEYRSPHPDAPFRRPRQRRLRADRHCRRRVADRIQGRGHHLERSVAPPPARPVAAAAHLLFPHRRRPRDRRQRGGQCIALDQPLVRAELRSRRDEGPRLHQGIAQHRRRRRAQLRLRPDHRRALHRDVAGRVPLLVRLRGVPRHAAVAQGRGRREEGHQEEEKKARAKASKALEAAKSGKSGKKLKANKKAKKSGKKSKD